MNHEVLKRFVKDYNLPIGLIQEPYFQYFLNLYDKTHNCKKKFELLQSAIKEIGNEQLFMEHYYKIRDQIITTIEATDAYKKYNEGRLDQFNVEKKYPKRDVFKCDNVGKYFISIDLVKANFQAMKYFDKNLVLGAETYQELIGKFSSLDYMKESKYLRQVIFGHMNPKRQIKIEEFLISKILSHLIPILKEENIKMVSSDEVVFEIPDISLIDKDLDKKLTFEIKNIFNIDVDIEIYQLDQIGQENYFVKKFINKSGEELKSIPLNYFAQAYKKYYGLKINKYDLSFYYEHQICRFLKPIWNNNNIFISILERIKEIWIRKK